MQDTPDRRKTVLLVEDDYALRTIIKQRLERSGYEVKSADGFAAACQFLKSGTPVDLIWLDHFVSAEDETGIMFLDILRGFEIYKGVPIFVVTACDKYDVLSEYIKSGVLQCYSKTHFDLDAILGDINSLCDLKLIS